MIKSAVVKPSTTNRAPLKDYSSFLRFLEERGLNRSRRNGGKKKIERTTVNDQHFTS